MLLALLVVGADFLDLLGLLGFTGEIVVDSGCEEGAREAAVEAEAELELEEELPSFSVIFSLGVPSVEEDIEYEV